MPLLSSIMEFSLSVRLAKKCALFAVKLQQPESQPMPALSAYQAHKRGCKQLSVTCLLLPSDREGTTASRVSYKRSCQRVVVQRRRPSQENPAKIEGQVHGCSRYGARGCACPWYGVHQCACCVIAPLDTFSAGVSGERSPGLCKRHGKRTTVAKLASV